MRAEHTSSTDQFSYTLPFCCIEWFVWLGSWWSFIFRMWIHSDRGPFTWCSHCWSLPSDPTRFPDELFFRRQPIALCPSCPHRTQWVQQSFPCATHCWHLLLTSDLVDCFGCGGVARVYSGATFPTGVRTFSKVLVKDETSAVSSCMAVRSAWTSACIWAVFCLS